MSRHDTNRCRRHAVYKLTCQQFDDLFTEADGCCQVCRLPEAETSHRRLVIDHDASLGFWAVRGLLCGRCNTDIHRRSDEAVQAFHRNAWHLRHRPEFEPVEIPEIATVSLNEAAHLVAQAADAAQAVAAGDLPAKRAAYGRLRDAARVATKSGLRQREIVLLTDGFWSREKVYYAIHQDGRRVA